MRGRSLAMGDAAGGCPGKRGVQQGQELVYSIPSARKRRRKMDGFSPSLLRLPVMSDDSQYVCDRLCKLDSLETFRPLPCVMILSSLPITTSRQESLRPNASSSCLPVCPAISTTDNGMFAAIFLTLLCLNAYLVIVVLLSRTIWVVAVLLAKLPAEIQGLRRWTVSVLSLCLFASLRHPQVIIGLGVDIATPAGVELVAMITHSCGFYRWNL